MSLLPIACNNNPRRMFYCYHLCCVSLSFWVYSYQNRAHQTMSYLTMWTALQSKCKTVQWYSSSDEAALKQHLTTNLSIFVVKSVTLIIHIGVYELNCWQKPHSAISPQIDTTILSYPVVSIFCWVRIMNNFIER